jgi:hypothetical protein
MDTEVSTVDTLKATAALATIAALLRRTTPSIDGAQKPSDGGNRSRSVSSHKPTMFRVEEIQSEKSSLPIYRTRHLCVRSGGIDADVQFQSHCHGDEHRRADADAQHNIVGDAIRYSDRAPNDGADRGRRQWSGMGLHQR